MIPFFLCKFCINDLFTDRIVCAAFNSCGYINQVEVETLFYSFCTNNSFQNILKKKEKETQ